MPKEELHLDQKIAILLVDDREENLVALEAVLASEDYVLLKANSGDEALKQLLAHRPALILMDVQMPGMDGFQTANIIRKSERLKNIPIIFITAISQEERYVQRGYEHGAVDYIFKPFDVRILRSKVAVFVDLHRKTQQLIKQERLLLEKERSEREKQLALLELKSLRREQAEQQKYFDLVSGIEQGIVWATDPNTFVFSFVSQSVEKITGIPYAACLQEIQFWRKYTHKDDIPVVEQGIAEARAHGKDVRFNHRFISRNGKTLWLRTFIKFAQKDETGEYELRGLSVDITSVKLAEKRLEISGARAELLAKTSLLLSHSLDFRKTIPSIAEQMTELFSVYFKIEVNVDSEQYQLTKGEVPPSTWEETEILAFSEKARKDAQSFQIRMKEHQLNVIPISPREQNIGTLVLITNTTTVDEEDAIDLRTIEDLARRIGLAIDNFQLFKEAQDAVKARDEFISIASHELKTPLTPLKLQTQSLSRTMKRSVQDPVVIEKMDRMIETTDRQIGRLSKLIDDLLDISRINVGQLQLAPEEFDALELVKDTIDRFQGPSTTANCSIHLEFNESSSFTVKWDRFRVEQVMNNLLSNAIKYGPGKPVHVQCSLTSTGNIQISFKDQGIGIAHQDQARIFERFERAVSSRHFGGLGLGLFIVNQIVRAHYGQITVQSVPGEGSNFIVTIPIDPFSTQVADSTSTGLKTAETTAKDPLESAQKG